MTPEQPDWLPVAEDEQPPREQQQTIIESQTYPMRVLAGAGTGKTFTMVRKIENLIDEQGVSPDRILALTFTNNAADSMREKLNAKLGTAGYDIDAYTYHSICNEILTDYAYEAGVDPDFDIITDAEKYAIVLDVLDEIKYRSVKPNVYGPESFADGAASKLLSFIESMKRNGIVPADVDSFLGPAERLYELDGLPERIGSIAGDHLGGRSVGSVLDGIPDASRDIAAERERLESDGLEGCLRDFLDRLVDLCDALEAAFEAHQDGEQSLPENAHKLPKYLLGGYSSGAPSGIPNDLKMELPDHLEDFLEDCKTARDLTAGYEAYERELTERGLIDFDGLVVETQKLLQGDVADEIAGRWDYVFCDEFQDTDRLQFDLVTALVSDDRLFVVGDDDQAIYEWRGANVDNITSELDAKYGDSLTDEPLLQNFRSRQPILDLANEALELVDERQFEKTLTRVEEPDYDGTSVAVIEEPEEAQQRGEQLVTLVRNLLSGEAKDLDQSYDPEDVALLVRKNDHATPILESFDRAGIPYQVSGDLATESIGVGTVVAYLKALARPETDEVSWNRVLTMRYRLCDRDLRLLNDHDDGLLTALLDVPLNQFEEPDTLREARNHVKTLLELRDTASLGHFYRELKDLTDIEWYLSGQERRDLDQLDEVIEQYGTGAVQPPLSPDFIESLQHYDSLLDESGSTPSSQPDLADDAVNVMTGHKSKGLDFPVVLMPRLTADEWEPSSRTFGALEEALATGPTAAFDEDFVARDARETRRVLHVGLTRTEDILVLQGQSGDEESAGEESDEKPGPSMHEAVDEILPSSIPWEPDSGHIPLWRDLNACLPAGASDWTDSLATNVVGSVGGGVTYSGDRLEPDEGREQVLSLATKSLQGNVESSIEEPTFEVNVLTGPSTPMPALRHSYTSLETFEECPRQHYLDYVVGAFDDYRETSGKVEGVSQQDIGLLFHDTAEIAAEKETTDPEGWHEICERLAGQRRARDALPAARACIDRYFELEMSSWEVVDAERQFQIEFDGHELVGFIDAVYRTSDGELVVIDYKATERTRDIEANRQLPLYLLACRDLYDEPVHRAGYAYVGEVGPRVVTRSYGASDLEAVRSSITKSIEQISETTFNQYEADDHCRWCTHNQLPCADKKYTVQKISD
ncbi:ATP-dependent helicase [Halosimplex aquaticum]|uniref:DNA 3'-5' helicase n=1 Tax=Halosimplex aquaticum TaxID=3026162 RepID=A0ABD5XXA5_9EURY|nr:ATP-dependent DNA helicase [Halosimplex aquaticum]